MHLNIRCFSVTDAVSKGKIKTDYCPIEQMLVDFFTKPLQGILLKKFRVVTLGHKPITSLHNHNDSTLNERVEVRNNEQLEQPSKQ